MGKSQLIILADILSWYFVTEVKQLFAKSFCKGFGQNGYLSARKLFHIICSWSYYIIPFLLFHSSILRLRLVGPVLAGADVVTGFTAMLLGSIDS